MFNFTQFPSLGGFFNCSKVAKVNLFAVGPYPSSVWLFGATLCTYHTGNARFVILIDPSVSGLIFSGGPFTVGLGITLRVVDAFKRVLWA